MMKDTGYYNKDVMRKFAQAMRDAMHEFNEGTLKHVKISNENSKMGKVASVSLMPFITCPDVCKGTCGAKCYAAKLANLRPSVLKSYARNTVLSYMNKEQYWKDVRKAVSKVSYFRFHVSGDAPDEEYVENMVETAVECPATEILVFTKRFDLFNEWIDIHGALPENMHVLFSGWTNLKPENPHHLPETTVYGKHEMPNKEWKLCGGNCFNCVCRGLGCWAARPGDTIAFKIH